MGWGASAQCRGVSLKLSFASICSNNCCNSASLTNWRVSVRDFDTSAYLVVKSDSCWCRSSSFALRATQVSEFPPLLIDSISCFSELMCSWICWSNASLCCWRSVISLHRLPSVAFSCPICPLLLGEGALRPALVWERGTGVGASPFFGPGAPTLAKS